MDNSAAEFWAILFERKGAEFKKNCCPHLIVSNSKEVSKKYCNFPTHTDKNGAFLKPKFLQKGKKGKFGGTNCFPQRPNFSSALAEKFCKELATL